MPQRNADSVRAAFEAYARGDFAAVLEGVDPEVVTYRAEPDNATYHGHEGMLRAFAEWVEDFDEFTATPEEVIEANDSQIVVRVHQHAVGSGSRVPIEADFWFVHTHRDGKLVRLDMFARRSQALESVGLPG